MSLNSRVYDRMGGRFSGGGWATLRPLIGVYFGPGRFRFGGGGTSGSVLTSSSCRAIRLEDIVLNKRVKLGVKWTAYTLLRDDY